MLAGLLSFTRIAVLTALIAPALFASDEAGFSEALRQTAKGNYAGAAQILERIVESDPLFSRAWASLVEVRQKQDRLTEFEATLAASTNPGACLGRMGILLARKSAGDAFDAQARACAARLPDSFAVYALWVRGVRPDRASRLRAEFAAAADAEPERFSLMYAASQDAPQVEARRRLERIQTDRLNSHDRNALDDDLSFAYLMTDPRRTEALQRLRDRARASGDSEWLSKANGRLAQMARNKGLFGEAFQLMSSARQGALELGQPTLFYEIVGGECLYRLGRTTEAIQLFLSSVASSEREGKPERRAQSLEWLAVLSNETGNHTGAVDYSLRALAISGPARFTLVSAGARIQLATAWLALGQGPRGLDSVREAESFLTPPMQNRYARILADAANLYLQLGLPKPALAAINKSFSADPSNIVRQAEAHLLRAEILVALHNPAEAARDLEAAAELAPEIPSYRARGQLTAGRIALDSSRYQSAAAAYTKALEFASGFPNLLTEAQTGLSDAYWRQGRVNDALAERQRAIQIIERIRSSLTAAHRAQYLAARIPLYRDSSQLLLRLNRIEEAFNTSEHARARELLDLSSESRQPVNAESLDLQSVRAAATAAELVRTVAQRRKADLDLQAATDRYLISAAGTVPTAAPLTLPQIQSQLTPSTAILHYTLGDPASSLFFVTRKRVGHFALPARTILDAEVRQARELLASRPERISQALLFQRLRHLYEVLVAPATAELRGIRELVIVADGALHTLPFEALVEPGDSGQSKSTPFLLRHFAIRYAPSASLAGPPSRPSHTSFLLAYGDPRGLREAGSPDGKMLVAAAERSLGAFGPLPFSRQEVEQVAALYPPTRRRVMLAAQATESALKNDPLLGSAGILHLAVHGFVDNAWPQMSGLVLPQNSGEDTTDDGILRIYEILALRLKTSLVVLSACDSGSGTDVTGEGLASLRRAFLAAGAKSIIASLWRVNDRAAATLMVGVHRRLVEGHSPAEALRAAQLETLATGAYSHPYYWAVFTLLSRGH